jgi:ATP-dependent RNA helicase RhlE
MASFQEGNLRGLITTDIMASLDISNITHVINFEMPAMPELYMHRIGRTGRADKTGQLVLLHLERKKQKWKLKS